MKKRLDRVSMRAFAGVLRDQPINLNDRRLKNMINAICVLFPQRQSFKALVVTFF